MGNNLFQLYFWLALMLFDLLIQLKFGFVTDIEHDDESNNDFYT